MQKLIAGKPKSIIFLIKVTLSFRSSYKSRVCLQCAYRVTCETRDVKYIRLIPIHVMIYWLFVNMVLFCFVNIFNVFIPQNYIVNYGMDIVYYFNTLFSQMIANLMVHKYLVAFIVHSNFCYIIHHAAEYLCNPLESFVFRATNLRWPTKRCAFIP